MDQINQIFKQTILGSKFAQNRYPVKNRKTDHHHWILHISINLSTKSQSKPSILIFWIKFVKKGISRSKTEKVNIIAFYIFKSWLHKNNPNLILHIRTSLGIKFYFKQASLNFGTRFHQKGNFCWKKKKVNITIELCIFKLV